MGYVYHPAGVFVQPDHLDFVAISLLQDGEDEFVGKNVCSMYLTLTGSRNVEWRKGRGMYELIRDGYITYAPSVSLAVATDRPYPPVDRPCTFDGATAVYCEREDGADNLRIYHGERSMVLPGKLLVGNSYWDALAETYDWIDRYVKGPKWGFPVGFPKDPR